MFPRRSGGAATAERKLRRIATFTNKGVIFLLVVSRFVHGSWLSGGKERFGAPLNVGRFGAFRLPAAIRAAQAGFASRTLRDLGGRDGSSGVLDGATKFGQSG